jgi:hypothetical protein
MKRLWSRTAAIYVAVFLIGLLIGNSAGAGSRDDEIAVMRATLETERDEMSDDLASLEEEQERLLAENAEIESDLTALELEMERRLAREPMPNFVHGSFSRAWDSVLDFGWKPVKKTVESDTAAQE